ncbi:hypothetical protein ACP70R_018078 [Stipagrostis hirtigluma subsp. patula]
MQPSRVARKCETCTFFLVAAATKGAFVEEPQAETPESKGGRQAIRVLVLDKWMLNKGQLGIPIPWTSLGLPDS